MRYFEDNIHILARGEWPRTTLAFERPEPKRWTWKDELADRAFLVAVVIGGALLWCWYSIVGKPGQQR